MAVLVDELRSYPHVRLPIRLWCHMTSDIGFEELHAFAARLGIDRARFQGDHYDLPPWLRASAVALGAEEVATREMIIRMTGPRGDRARRRVERLTVVADRTAASPATLSPMTDDEIRDLLRDAPTPSVPTSEPDMVFRDREKVETAAPSATDMLEIDAWVERHGGEIRSYSGVPPARGGTQAWAPQTRWYVLPAAELEL